MPERSEGVVTKLVLDVLKPHDPNIVDLAKELNAVKNVNRVDVSIVEVDADTETVKLIVEGHNLRLEDVEAVVKRLGAAIHSIDQVVVEKR